MNDLTEIVKIFNDAAQDSYCSGYKSGYDAGFRDGIKAVELLIAGKPLEEARAETYRNLP